MCTTQTATSLPKLQMQRLVRVFDAEEAKGHLVGVGVGVPGKMRRSPSWRT
mgnify:CR=1 FL=1|jgi:predicted NBD/HSP70 family sugar kinase